MNHGEGEAYIKELHMDSDSILRILEPKRIKGNVMKTVGICCMFCPFILGLFSNCFAESINIFVEIGIWTSYFVLLTVAIILLGYASKMQREYKNDYKQLIAKHVLQSCFDKANYYPDGGFTREGFQAAHLIYWRNDFTYRSEDLIIGQYAGVEFKQSDVRITHTTGSGKNKRTIVDVDGRLVQFHYRKDVRRRVLIVTDAHVARLEKGLFKIEMEDIDFNKKFDVYSEDGHSAYYLLTPPFMEYLKKLRELDQNIYISFDGENLYILRSGKGGIFVPPKGKIDLKDEVEKSKLELNEIKNMIDILQLDDEAYKDKIFNM